MCDYFFYKHFTMKDDISKTDIVEEFKNKEVYSLIRENLSILNILKEGISINHIYKQNNILVIEKCHKDNKLLCIKLKTDDFFSGVFHKVDCSFNMRNKENFGNIIHDINLRFMM